MTTVRAWKPRPGSDDKTIQGVRKTGKVRLDYEVPGLSPDMTREDLIDAIRTRNPDRSDNGTLSRADQIDALFKQVRKGDLALGPRDKGRSMMIGEILSDQPAVTRTSHEVQVRWIDENVPLSWFDKDLRYWFMAIHKFCGVSRNKAPERLKRIANGESDPEFSG